MLTIHHALPDHASLSSKYQVVPWRISCYTYMVNQKKRSRPRVALVLVFCP